MSSFLGYWFSGFEQGMDCLSEEQRRILLSECGKACSKSYTLKVYQELWAKTQTIPNFFHELNQEIAAVSVKEIKKGEQYELYYRECLCDLHTSGYVNSGKLCECSKQSLIYNLNRIFTEYKVDVELLGSILEGAELCSFRIKISN